MDWFLYDSGLRHERVKNNYSVLCNDIAAYGLVVNSIHNSQYGFVRANFDSRIQYYFKEM